MHGNGHTPPYDDCLLQIVAAARSAGKPAGILVRHLDDLPRIRALGYTHIAIDSDVAILRQRYQNLIAVARQPELRESALPSS